MDGFFKGSVSCKGTKICSKLQLPCQSVSMMVCLVRVHLHNKLNHRNFLCCILITLMNWSCSVGLRLFVVTVGYSSQTIWATDDQLIFTQLCILPPPTSLQITRTSLDLHNCILQIVHLVFQNTQHCLTKVRKESISPTHNCIKIIDWTPFDFVSCLQIFSPHNSAVRRLFEVADLVYKGD